MNVQQTRDSQEMPTGIPFVFSKNFPVLPAPGFVFWKWDKRAGMVSHSPEWLPSFGAAGENPPGAATESWWQRLFDEDRDLLNKTLTDCAAGCEASIDLAVRVRRLDDGWGWLLVRGSATITDMGRRELAGYATDVSRLSDDKPFVSHVRDTSETYRAILENSPDPILRLDRDLSPLYANPAINSYLPAPTEEPENANTWELGISEDLRHFHQQNVATVFETGAVVKETASLQTSLRGETTGEYCYWPEFGPDGRVCAVICQMRDLTTQVRAEQERSLNEERFAALNRLTQMQEASGEEIIQYVVEQMALLTKSEHSYLFFPSEGRSGVVHWSKSVQELIEPEKLPRNHLPLVCCAGKRDIANEVCQPFIVNLNDDEDGYVVFDTLSVRRYVILPAIEDGRVVCVISVCNKDTDYDESDLRQLELFINSVRLVLRRNRYMHALEKAKETAESANRAKDEFLANVSHELRTPLNGVLSMLQLLQLSSLSGEQREYVQTASLSGKALLRILSDILDFSRMESGKMELHEGIFDLRETLLSTMGLFTSQARSKGLEATVSIGDTLPEALVGDDARVRQIVFNLVGNALKFTQKGGIALECSLLPHSARGKAWIYIAVRDTGIGIPPQAHAAVFDAFTQLDSSSTREYPGTGLGLGIVKRLLRMMGGTLTVESEIGEGTTIHCSLPFTRADRRVEDKIRRQFSFGVPVGQGLDVLVAEDDPVGRFALRAFLQRAGHRVVCVETGRHALEALQLHPFDCLISDIQMPIMDGLETVRRIRQGHIAGIVPTQEVLSAVRDVIPEAGFTPYVKIPEDMPVVALTAHAMSGDREYFLRMGMDMYLAKPIILEELYAILDRVLASKSGKQRIMTAQGG